MDICASKLPAGININCLAVLAQVRNVILLSPGETFDSMADFRNLAKWKTKVQEELTASVFAGLHDYEDTTDDPNIKTSGLGKKFVTNQPVPSGVFYLDTNFCDYKNALNTLNGGTYSVVYILEDGSILGYLHSDGKVGGFTARINAITKGIPTKDDLDMNYRVFINHTNYSQFESSALVLTSWKVDVELAAAMPLGFSTFVTTAYETAGGTVKVYVSERCGDPVTALTTVEFIITETNDLDTPVVSTCVDDGLGHYTLTLEKSAVPEAMEAGDYMIIQVQAKTGAVYDNISNELLIQA